MRTAAASIVRTGPFRRLLHDAVGAGRRRPRPCVHAGAPSGQGRRSATCGAGRPGAPAGDAPPPPGPAEGEAPAPTAVPAPPPLPPPKRKPSRAATAKNSLRRVAIIAQKPKRGAGGPPSIEHVDPDPSTTISAVCMAESFNMATVIESLAAHGFAIDPDRTGFESGEVVHAKSVNGGDIFVFPSGTVVTWSLPPDVVTKQLAQAAEDAHPPGLREAEHLDFVVDNSKSDCTMRDDLVVLGTRREHRDGDRLDTTLAKIAFSSGLARSTKLAVLESALMSYFESMRNIPTFLSKGTGVVPLGRRFILQKTGELLSLRARLNHYSELTDSLPDIFWDSRAELGLEGYYDQVGRALDVNVRIRILNQKMDYAQEIASVLREMSSEQHGTRLELIIILLIAVEVIFELRRIWLEWSHGTEPAMTAKHECQPRRT